MAGLLYQLDGIGVYILSLLVIICGISALTTFYSASCFSLVVLALSTTLLILPGLFSSIFYEKSKLREIFISLTAIWVVVSVILSYLRKDFGSIILAVPFLFLLGYVSHLFGKAIPIKPTLPCAVSLIPRQVPSIPIYLRWYFLFFPLGIYHFLITKPFLDGFSIFFWQHSYQKAFTFASGLILFLCLSIGSLSKLIVFIRMNLEIYPWCWFSFLSSCGYPIIFIFYWIVSSGFSSFRVDCPLSILLLLSLSILCGSISHLSSSFFLRRLYKEKSD